MAKLDADALLHFLGHCVRDTPNTHNQMFWLLAGKWSNLSRRQ